MNQIKILFEHYNTPEGDYGIESAWAFKVGNFYKLDNILFYAKNFSIGDIVSAENRNGELYVNGLIKESGHSTVRVIFFEDDEISSLRLLLKNLGCESEVSNIPQLISIDIPPKIDYGVIKRLLEKGKNISKWDYEEACIAHTI